MLGPEPLVGFVDPQLNSPAGQVSEPDEEQYDNQNIAEPQPLLVRSDTGLLDGRMNRRLCFRQFDERWQPSPPERKPTASSRSPERVQKPDAGQRESGSD